MPNKAQTEPEGGKKRVSQWPSGFTVQKQNDTTGERVNEVLTGKGRESKGSKRLTGSSWF